MRADEIELLAPSTVGQDVNALIRELERRMNEQASVLDPAFAPTEPYSGFDPGLVRAYWGPYGRRG
jgi:hypothetical protein